MILRQLGLLMTAVLGVEVPQRSKQRSTQTAKAAACVKTTEVMRSTMALTGEVHRRRYNHHHHHHHRHHHRRHRRHHHHHHHHSGINNGTQLARYASAAARRGYMHTRLCTIANMVLTRLNPVTLEA